MRGAYDGKAEGFVPGGISLHNCMLPHGPDAATFLKASVAELEPQHVEDTLAFMFESRHAFELTQAALAARKLTTEYDADVLVGPNITSTSMAAKPEAVLIVASGTPSTLPQLELYKRGYSGTVYQTQAVADNDYLRIGGKAVEGTIIPVSPVPVALEKAKPGTPEFRIALRDAIERGKELVLSQGVYTMTPKDHNGADSRSQVLIKVENGAWRYME